MKTHDGMTDKERILMAIVAATALKATHFGPGAPAKDESCWISGWGDATKKIKAGDFVLCQTNPRHPFGVAIVVAVLGYSECLLREIGTERTCRMSNESFSKLHGVDTLTLLEGPRYRLLEKVKAAFHRGGWDYYRFAGLDFTADGQAVISVREKFGGHRYPGPDSIPFHVALTWDKRTTVKAITAALVGAGVGTRAFDPPLIDHRDPEAVAALADAFRGFAAGLGSVPTTPISDGGDR